MIADEKTSFLVVLTTLPDPESARSLVKHLVTRRLAACGTIVDGAFSVYTWHGKQEETAEVTVVLKTSRDRWGELQAAVLERHPYDVPELLALPVEAGLPAYLEWLAEQTTPESP